MINLVGFDLDDTLYNATSLASQARIGGLKKIQECGLKFTMQEGIAALFDVVKEFGSNYSKHYDELLERMKKKPDKFGISVDDTIHFLAKYRQELIHHKWNVRKSVYAALRETGVSMFYTSIVLFPSSS